MVLAQDGTPTKVQCNQLSDPYFWVGEVEGGVWSLWDLSVWAAHRTRVMTLALNVYIPLEV